MQAAVFANEQQMLHEYRKMVNAFQIYLGRNPTEWEIMHNLGLNDRINSQ